MRRLFALACLAVCLPATALAEDRDLGLLEYTVEPTQAMQLSPMKNGADRDVLSEARMWADFGLRVPEKMVRIVVRKNAPVEVDVYWYFSAYESPADKTYMAFMHAVSKTYLEFIRKCQPVGASSHIEACRRSAVAGAEAQNLLQEFSRLGIWNLPDQRDVNDDGNVHGTDGSSIVVELRVGAHYRSYSWSNPDTSSGKEGKRADALLTRMWAFASEGE